MDELDGAMCVNSLENFPLWEDAKSMLLGEMKELGVV